MRGEKTRGIIVCERREGVVSFEEVFGEGNAAQMNA